VLPIGTWIPLLRISAKSLTFSRKFAHGDWVQVALPAICYDAASVADRRSFPATGRNGLESANSDKRQAVGRKARRVNAFRVTSFALLAGLAAGGIYLLVRNPPSAYPWLPSCVFHRVTGLYCPGCGSTRALHHLVHGRIGEALRFNPLMVLSIPFLSYLWLREHVLPLLGRPSGGLARSTRMGWIVFAIVVSYWALRNVPVFPFTLLAPGGGS
jgi:hypothetical protein